MSAPAHWSFAGRMMRLYLIGTTLLVLAVGATSFWLLAAGPAKRVARDGRRP